MEPKIKSFTLPLDDCPTVAVTVYSDRAEVSRSVITNLEEGSQEIVVKGLSKLVDESSVRVSGVKGNATILEVSSELCEFTNEKEELALQLFKDKCKSIQEDETKANIELTRLQKENEWLEKYASNFMFGMVVEDKGVKQKSAISCEDASKFMDFYRSHLKRLDESRQHFNKELEELKKKKTKIEEEEQNRIKKDRKGRKRDVTVAVQVHQKGEIILELSYIITNASWLPEYQARVISKSKKIQLSYQGTITNNTEDDWKDVKMSLSTAQPSIGGHPPKLTTRKVTYVYPSYGYPSAPLSRMMDNPMMNAMQQDFKIDRSSDRSERELSSPPPMTTEVTQGTTSSTFAIPRRSTIQSDGKPHKVTIAIIDLDAQFSYTVIPQLSRTAYLRAIAQNTSTYEFLEGQMAVFIDNNFIANSKVKKTNPSEELSLFLGVDNGINVEFKEEQINQSAKGLISKSKKIHFTHTTSIKNTKAEDVDVSLFTQLPLSSEDKIIVTLVKPNLKEESSLAILNKFNNIRWSLSLKAGDQKQIQSQFIVEYPADKELSFS